MNKSFKHTKLDSKSKSGSKNNFYYEEESISFKEVKKQQQKKQYRNYENALRSKNVSALLSYEDD